MRSRSTIITGCLTLISAAVALGGYLRTSGLKTEGAWYAQRGAALAEAYVESFDGELADAQLASLDKRRELMSRAQLWQRVQLLGVLATIVGAMLTWLLHLFNRLRAQLEEPADQAAGHF